MHGPETLEQHERRERAEAVAAARKTRRQQERERAILADSVFMFRRRAHVANDWVTRARESRDAKTPCGEFWAHAAHESARVALDAADIARRSLPLQARAWMRRAADWADSAAESANNSANALRDEVDLIKVALTMVRGDAVLPTPSTERPALRVVTGEGAS
jgi:hypothetical protein